MDKSAQKASLEALLRALAEEETRKQGGATLPSPSEKKETPARTGRVAWFAEIAREQVSRETWEERQRYLYPPVIPEDVARSILDASMRGKLDLAEDPVSANLMDAGEIRKLIQAGRLDPSELPLLKYRIERLVGLSTEENLPGRREMLSSLAYHVRGDASALEEIRESVLEELRADLENGAISHEEAEQYRSELHQIIDQYLV